MESIPPAYEALRTSMTTIRTRFLAPIDCSKIPRIKKDKTAPTECCEKGFRYRCFYCKCDCKGTVFKSSSKSQKKKKKAVSSDYMQYIYHTNKYKNWSSKCIKFPQKTLISEQGTKLISQITILVFVVTDTGHMYRQNCQRTTKAV